MTADIDINDLADPSPEVVHAAETACRRLGSDAVQLLCDGLPKVEPKAQARACSLLGELGRGDEQAFKALEAVATKPGEARWAALEALTDLAGARAIPILEKVLGTADDSVCAYIAELLGDIPGKDSFELLLKLAGQSPDRVRAVACKSLGRQGDQVALPVLLNALGDPDNKTSSEAFNSILAFGGAGIELLLETAKNHEDPRWRAAALPVANHIDRAQGLVLLEAALANHELEAEQAATLLGELRSRPAVEMLIKALDRSEDDVKIAVIKALGHIGDIRAAEPLTKLRTKASQAPKTIPSTEKSLGFYELLHSRREVEDDGFILGEDEEGPPDYGPRFKQNALGLGNRNREKQGQKFDAEGLAEIPAEIEKAQMQIQESNEVQEVYPNIAASNEHPVIGEVVKLEVTLNKEPSSTTSGKTILPDAAPDFVFKLRVNLLCADISEWQNLDYSKAEGTIKPAQFTVTAPKIKSNVEGNYPDRAMLLVRANFYYENRWCGEGRRYLDLLHDDLVASLKEIPQLEESEWQKFINLEQGTQPADLLVRIQEEQGGYYRWSFLSPHLEFTGTYNAIMKMKDGPEAWINDLLKPYTHVDLRDLEQSEIENIGKLIYDSTPDAFKQAYWKLFNEAGNLGICFNSIVFISDEQFVPWELMHIATEGVEPEFLGIRHAVGRWLAEASSRLVQNISVQQFVVTGSGYPNIPPINPLPWVEAELGWLKKHYKLQRIALNSTTILDFLKNGTAQAVHFACHGQSSNKSSLLNELVMEDYPKSIKALSINGWKVQGGLGKQHPIIFLNACQAAVAGNQLGLVVGFPAAFLAVGASAVICPLWRISDEHAKEVTEKFYQATFAQSGKTLGEILQTIREQWESEHNLTFLAYVLYGDPQARIIVNPLLIISETDMEDFELEENVGLIELDAGITLLAPGLSGPCRYVGARTHGTTRAFSAEQTGLDQAITEANLEDRHTLVIEAPTPEPQSEQGERGGVFKDAVGNNEILLQVPGYLDEQQFLMYIDESGIISFHYPVAIEPKQALTSTRSIEAAVQNQYRITLRAGQDLTPNKSAADSRGLFGNIGSKILKVLVTKVFKKQTGNAVHWAIQQWENRCRAFQGLHGGRDFSELMSESPLPFVNWDGIRGKKALLFIHGTSSSTAGAFAGLLKSNMPESLYEQYQGRVLAFNHHTMSVSVAENVKQFYDAFADHPGDYSFDIICHSRGGLVARALNHLSDDFIAGRLKGWRRPSSVNIMIDRIVFVAAPNAGTELALPDNLSAMIERLANYVNQFPDGLASISGGMLLTLASAIVDAGLPYVPGLEDQSPDSELLKHFTDSNEQAKRYYGFGANYEVEGNLKSVVKTGVIAAGTDVLVDHLFKDKANDFVVPTLGVAANANFHLEASHMQHFQGSVVHHTNFFFQPEIENIFNFLAK